MILEVVFLLSMVLGGSALIQVAGARGLGVPVLGAVAGLALYLCIGALQVLTPITTTPLLTMILTAAIPSALWLWRRFRGAVLPVRPLWAGIIVAGVVAAVALFRALPQVAWSYDSLQYLLNGSLIANNSITIATSGLLPKRLIGVPELHAAANLGGEYYVQSITPLISVLVLALLSWMLWESLATRLNKRALLLLIVGGVLFLVSMNRFVFHAFYLNGHLLFALLMLVIVGGGWMLVSTESVSKTALVTAMALSIGAVVFVRAESPILVFLVLLPVIVDRSVSVLHKSILLAILGVATIAWQLFMAAVYRADGLSVEFSVWGLLAFGVLMLAAIPLLRWNLLMKRGRMLLLLAEALLWVALIVLALREPLILRESLSATFQNVVMGAGSWGVSLILLAVLLVVASFIAVPNSVNLRFPLTSFVPLGFLLAYLRDAAYRVGDGDSLNRMWIQLVPVALFYVLIALGVGQWRRSSTVSQAKPSSVANKA
ncbi:hypothetical protein I6E81_12290 [Salinibacterium sp. NG22]|uniref:hypothetical protein n=1 Tax=Salinibacterium sp. NG22 TaxID=2792040 RepID=UPI0018CF60C0|nr:hypothetical protein [Salinibacterium sp. NG22]MBH0110947.1 hypothetical protein [Salinibacterium sp. NG22]